MKNEQRGISKVAIVAIVVIVIVVVAVVAILQMKPTSPEEGPPRPGEWTASTGTSKFSFGFTVDDTSTNIPIISCSYHRSTYSMTFSTPWPITDGQFTIEWPEVPTNSDIVIQGSFDETGTHASGTWEISVQGTDDRQTGTWEASAP